MRAPSFKFVFVLFLGMTEAGILTAQTVPQDAAHNCAINSKDFNSWFQSGTPSANGLVNPASSLAFSESSVCDFYIWAKRMFLWVTSPFGNSRVFDSTLFYDVSPPDSNGQRSFLPHTKALFIHSMALRSAKKGPHGLPVIEDKSGEPFEVIKPEVNDSGKQVIIDTTGSLEEVNTTAITENHKLRFQNRAGKTIEPLFAAPVEKAALPANAIRTAHEFMVNGSPVFVDSSGNIIDVEQGQAGSMGVLETQSNGLTYYLALTNDVYAYFLTGVKNGGIPSSKFPTDATSLDEIKKYAALHGKPKFGDGQALVLELKSSWMEVSNLVKGQYITTTATVPTYDKSNQYKWVANGQKKVTLGLLGLHIVGSVAGHPEMIWATFEHFGNTPNAAYKYQDTKGNNVLVPQNTKGTWLFSGPNSSGPFNSAHMTAQGTNIVAASGFTVSPSDSLRTYPWGAAGGNASANSNFISIQNAVNALMPTGDLRNNYFLVGATWTTGGTAPPGALAGATNVANSTMETYTQSPNGCFTCHSSATSPSLAPNVLSHIFGDENTGLKPLFPAINK